MPAFAGLQPYDQVSNRFALRAGGSEGDHENNRDDQEGIQKAIQKAVEEAIKPLLNEIQQLKETNIQQNIEIQQLKETNILQNQTLSNKIEKKDIEIQQLKATNIHLINKIEQLDIEIQSLNNWRDGMCSTFQPAFLYALLETVVCMMCKSNGIQNENERHRVAQLASQILTAVSNREISRFDVKLLNDMNLCIEIALRSVRIFVSADKITADMLTNWPPNRNELAHNGGFIDGILGETGNDGNHANHFTFQNASDMRDSVLKSLDDYQPREEDDEDTLIDSVSSELSTILNLSKVSSKSLINGVIEGSKKRTMKAQITP